MMLSRHAEDLFWVGRYMERAENTARMLDVTYHSALEAGSDRTAEEVWGDLYAILKLDDDEIEGLGGGRSLIFDTSLSFSIRSTVTKARENTRGTRELVSAEVWEAVNSLHLELQRSASTQIHDDRPYDVLRLTKSWGQTFSGAVYTTMARGDGFRFIQIGQMLERAATTVRTLQVWNQRLSTHPAASAHAEWVKLLKSVSGHEAYLRTHRAQITSGRVIDFLTQSVDFPRSVVFCLRGAEENLMPMVLAETGSPARRLLGRVRSTAEFSEPSALDRDGLSDLLSHIEREILRVGDEIDRAFFRPGSAVMHAFEAF
ncbi:MAG TPA: alpha-E domain-containing protein [Acidimicrobiia bacterium]|jgi:uncharacterized alpha-E superfamily protein